MPRLLLRSLYPTEDQEQIALIKLAQHHPITRDYLASYPIEGFRHIKTAILLKRKGARDGYPDLQLLYPSNGYHGLLIELKRLKPRKGVLSPNQKVWIARLRDAGYYVDVAYGADEAWQQIMNYLR